MQWRREFPKWVKSNVVPEDSKRRRWWWNRLFVQIATSNEYPNEAEVFTALKATQRDRSAAVLAEAQEVFRRPFETSEGVERRAATLQGAIAIAASFVLAGGGLLLDTTKIRTESWRIAFAVVIAIVIICLVFSALRSLRATSRVLEWHYPEESDLLLKRQGSDAGEHDLAVAAGLLHAGGANVNNANYKVAQMRAAGHWLALALAGLLVTALLLLTYIVADPGAAVTSANTNTANTKTVGTMAVKTKAASAQAVTAKNATKTLTTSVTTKTMSKGATPPAPHSPIAPSTGPSTSPP